MKHNPVRTSPLAWLCAAFAALVLFSSATQAQTSLIQVSGVFASAQSEDTHGLNTLAPLLDQSFTLLFTYDPSVPDADNFISNTGRWTHMDASHVFSLSSGGVSISVDPSTTSYQIIALTPAAGSTNTPNFYVTSGNVGTSGAANGITVTGPLTLPNEDFEFSLGFGTNSASPSSVAFLTIEDGDDPLPSTPFFLGEPLGGPQSPFAFISLSSVVGYDDVNMEDIYAEQTLIGTITSISAIPEPSTISLIFGCFAAAFALARRRIRAT